MNYIVMCTHLSFIVQGSGGKLWVWMTIEIQVILVDIYPDINIYSNMLVTVNSSFLNILVLAPTLQVQLKFDH